MDPQFIQAKLDFQRARQQAKVQKIVASLTGTPLNLLVFEDVREKLKVLEGSGRELKNIPIPAIIGSVGRYNDFDRQFLPLRDEDRERWARVKLVMEDLRGLPPIEVYQVGEAYFVVDGNHRVSIARQLGATEIEAYVRTVQTRVPLPASAKQEDLIVLSEFADFLELTRLDEHRSNSEIRLTEAGQYKFLLQQIEVQQFILELQTGEEINYPEAVCQWFDNIYQPIVEIIRTQNLLKNFPNRTEADLFVWVLNHQALLSKQTGWRVRADAALRDLTEKVPAGGLSARIRNAVLDTFPLFNASSPAAGQWRIEHQLRPGRMFEEILVPLISTSGETSSWPVLTCAFQIAQHEQAQVYGLYLSPKKRSGETQQNLQNHFNALCQQTEITGNLIFENGKASVILPQRSRWVDLIILQLHQDSPGQTGKNAVSSMLRTLLQKASPPILIIPNTFTFPKRVLLAYDCSKKAQEALYLAAYLSSFWGVELVVYSVLPLDTTDTRPNSLHEAKKYLQTYLIDATFCHTHGQVSDAILQAAGEFNCDLILMGGYGEVPFFGGFHKRTVDDILSKTNLPVWICQ